MKISYNWLKDYLPIDLNPEEVSDILTSIGLEVEGQELFHPVKGGLEGVVTGEVISCVKHPSADKLSLAIVDVGNEKNLQIVCGAPNIAAGQKVPVATIGATLYKGDDSLTIKKTKIRGQLSEGMICAEDELGLGDSHDGIMVLDPETAVGKPAAEYFNIETDTVFEIGLTPNRIDAASHYGVARDLAAWIGQTSESKLIQPDVSGFKPDNNNYPVKIIIGNREGCIRYSGVTISGVKVESSPGWIQDRLKAIGLKPINNVVDITNYVLHETGQPLHAFNADMIKGRTVTIDNLPEGSKITTLDGEERELSSDDLIICNDDEGMCIAGVFGGINTGVDFDTTNVFLESACFDPVSVRKTARRHSLNTDASFRFERGTDPEATVRVLKRAAIMIKEIAGGQISSEVEDIYPEVKNPVELQLDLDYVRRLIGVDIPEERISRILNLLDFKTEKSREGFLDIKIPLYRVDVTRQADVAEEILRIYGYNNVPVPESVHSTLSYSDKIDKERYNNAIAGMLSGLGYNEIMSNSLTRSVYYQKLKKLSDKNLVKIVNPLSSDLDSLRQTMLFGGLETILYNSNRKNPDLKLYEFGNIYTYTSDGNKKGDLNNYSESEHMAIFITGAYARDNWNSKKRVCDFFDIKAVVNQVLERVGLDPDQLNHEESDSELFLYGLQLRSESSGLIATYGTVHPAILELAEIKNDVFYAELNWSNLVREASEKRISFSEIPKYPEVRRDLAMELDKSIEYSTIRKIVFETEKKLVTKINLFDVYQGDKISEGKKSYAISFRLQDPAKTLKDKDIDKTMNRISNALQKRAGARIRQ